MAKIEVVKTEIRGVTVYVETHTPKGFPKRGFRFDASGNAEYAYVRELELEGERARFYGHVFKRDIFTLR